jgi:predicted phage baseplate assembly protein
VGSGDASRRFQSFTLQKQPLTYVPGSGVDGVVSSLKVRVNGLLWQEVPGLFEQPANAQVYSTSTAESGRRQLQFGDGVTGGTVLPTGQGNVTATYRVGAGLAGRVGANVLTTLLDRLQGLSSVTNPLSAEGGADAETLQAIRSNAPRTVRTFGRAVSLQDFADLITASGEVAKAEAIWVWDGLAPAIFLTVAGQGGGTFSDPASLAASLNNERDTNRRLLVGNYRGVPIQLSATILTMQQYVQEDVVLAARNALLTALSFDRLSLGQSLHLSGVYTVLQNVPGVQAVDINQLGFRRPAGMSMADFEAYLDSRAVERLTDGSVASIQAHLRIFSARPDPGVPGKVLSAELAMIESPGQDISITAQGTG